jgi:hypothetical protein
MHPGIPTLECRSLAGFHWVTACRRYLPGVEKRIAFLLVFLAAGLLPVQPCVAGSGVFENTGSRVAPDFGDSATLLPNGKVLAAGELYDPARGTWALTGSGGSFTPRLLPNGKVLSEGSSFFNGHVTQARPFAWLYNPASGTWDSTANMTTARYEHEATLLPNGLALVTGGLDVFALPDAEVFDPASETWSHNGRLITARANHSATLLPNGKVLIAGGDNGYGNGVLEARNCMIRRAGPRRAPAALVSRAIFTGQYCCPTAVCSLSVALTVLIAPILSPARNCTIRRAGLGRRPAALAAHAVAVRRRCYPTERYSWQAVMTALPYSQAPNSTIQPAVPGRLPEA